MRRGSTCTAEPHTFSSSITREQNETKHTHAQVLTAGERFLQHPRRRTANHSGIYFPRIYFDIQQQYRSNKQAFMYSSTCYEYHIIPVTVTSKIVVCIYIYIQIWMILLYQQCRRKSCASRVFRSADYRKNFFKYGRLSIGWTGVGTAVEFVLKSKQKAAGNTQQQRTEEYGGALLYELFRRQDMIIAVGRPSHCPNQSIQPIAGICRGPGLFTRHQ